MMQLEAVIWDLDGTLTDSSTLHYQAWRETMAGHGVEYSRELFLQGFGRNNFEILAEQAPTFSPAKINHVSEEKERAYRRLLQPGALELLPGVEGWLQFCRQLGLSQVVGSSAPMANITAMLHALEAADYFHAVLSGYRIPRGKPDPLLFMRCAASVDAQPAACLVVEDSIYGIEAAHRAGMSSLAVGSLACSPALAPYLEMQEPRCRAVATLADLAPQMIFP